MFNRIFPRFALPAAGFVVLAAIVALFAGWAYGLVALILGVVIIGGLAAGTVVATVDEAPFESDEATPAGDSPEHSDASSASETPAR